MQLKTGGENCSISVLPEKIPVTVKFVCTVTDWFLNHRLPWKGWWRGHTWRSAVAGCSGLWPVGFWMSLRMDTPTFPLYPGHQGQESGCVSSIPWHQVHHKHCDSIQGRRRFKLYQEDQVLQRRNICEDGRHQDQCPEQAQSPFIVNMT